MPTHTGSGWMQPTETPDPAAFQHVRTVSISDTADHGPNAPSRATGLRKLAVQLYLATLDDPHMEPGSVVMCRDLAGLLHAEAAHVEARP